MERKRKISQNVDRKNKQDENKNEKKKYII